MNYEDCLHETVQESVVELLKRLPELDPLDRWALLVEHIDHLVFVLFVLLTLLLLLLFDFVTLAVQ